jgi:hypothetical protein
MDDEAVALEQPGEAASEKMLTASQVNEIVKREKLKAAESARAQAEAQFRNGQGGQSQSAPPLDMNNLKDDLRKEVYEQFMGDLQKHQQESMRNEQEQHLKGIVDQYYIKMGKGSEMFSDFNQIMGDFEPESFPSTVLLVAQMENAPEIMYELANNPQKLSYIDELAKKSEKMAKKELGKLSESISNNLDAKRNVPNVPAPLSRPKSSSVGADTGKMTMKDLKKASYLRA